MSGGYLIAVVTMVISLALLPILYIVTNPVVYTITQFALNTTRFPNASLYSTALNAVFTTFGWSFVFLAIGVIIVVFVYAQKREPDPYSF